MNRPVRFYGPDGANERVGPDLAAGVAANDDGLVKEGRDNERKNEADRLTAGPLTNAKTGAKSDGGDQANVRGGDSTIPGAGGGLSDDGERTSGHDAAGMGLDD